MSAPAATIRVTETPDYVGVFFNGVGQAAGLFWAGVVANPWPWVAIAVILAGTVVLRSARRRTRRR